MVARTIEEQATQDALRDTKNTNRPENYAGAQSYVDRYGNIRQVDDGNVFNSSLPPNIRYSNEDMRKRERILRDISTLANDPNWTQPDRQSAIQQLKNKLSGIRAFEVDPLVEQTMARSASRNEGSAVKTKPFDIDKMFADTREEMTEEDDEGKVVLPDDNAVIERVKAKMAIRQKLEKDIANGSIGGGGIGWAQAQGQPREYLNEASVEAYTQPDISNLTPEQNELLQLKNDTIGIINDAIGMAASVGVGNYGLRPDGSQKGTGWLGELPVKGGGVATEWSMQSEAVKVDGKMIDFPTLVPTLTKEEIDLMVNDIIPNRKPLPDSIAQKAVDHANKQLSQGKSVWATQQPQMNEQQAEDIIKTNLSPEKYKELKRLGLSPLEIYQELIKDGIDVSKLRTGKQIGKTLRDKWVGGLGSRRPTGQEYVNAQLSGIPKFNRPAGI